MADTARSAALKGFGFSSAKLSLATIFLVSMFSYVDRSLLSVLQVPIKRDLGLSDGQIGALAGLSFALIYSTIGIPLSWLADRVSRTRLMAAALAIWSLMTALSGTAASFAVLVMLRMGLALGESACVPTGVSLNSDLFPREKRGLPMAVFASAVPLGTMVGLAGAGWLAEAIGWRHTFFLVGLSGLLLIPLLLSMREPERGRFDTGVASPEPLPFRKALRVALGTPGLRYVLAGNACQAFTYSAIGTWSAPFYSRSFGMSLAEIGSVLGLLFGLIGGSATLLGGFVSDRLCRRDSAWYGWFPALCVVMVVPLTFGQLLAHSAVISIAFGAAAAFFLNIYIAPVIVAAQAFALPQTRALTASLMAFVGSTIGSGLGPFATGVLSDRLTGAGFGPQALPLAIMASLAGALAAGFFFVRVAKQASTLGQVSSSTDQGAVPQGRG
jgi:predicted MFS family arabinose efflux permease